MAKEQGIPKIWENIDNIKSGKLNKTDEDLNTHEKIVVESINARKVLYNPRNEYYSDLSSGWWEIESNGVKRDSITIEYVQTGGSRVPSSGKIVIDQGWDSVGYSLYIREWDYWQQDGSEVVVSKVSSTQNIVVYVPQETYIVAYRTYEGQQIKLPMKRVGDIADTTKLTRADFLSTQISRIEKSNNGWCRFVNGLIIQWGTVTIPNNTSPVRIKLPIMYSTGTSYVSLCSTIKNINDVYKEVFSRAICNVDNANIEIASAYNSSSGARWLTIGY